jgi:DNA repair protein RadC
MSNDTEIPGSIGTDGACEKPEKVPRAYKAPIYRCTLVREGSIDARPYRTSSDVAQTALGILADYDREAFLVFLLDTRNRLIGINIVSVGTLTASLVHPREVFKPAVAASASAVIGCHNHPSGDPSPSREDAELTRRLWDAGKILGIRFLDHVVVGETGRHYSFADDGNFPPT